MLDRLRRAGSRGNKGREGIGDTRLSDINDSLDSRIGRGKDHERTRSSAKTWHPIKNMSITKKFVGCTTNPSCRIPAPFAKQIWIRHVRRFHWCPSQLEVSSIVIGKKVMPIQGHHNEVLLFLFLSDWRQQKYLAVGSMIEGWAKCYKWEEISVPGGSGQPNLVCVVAKMPNSQATDSRARMRLGVLCLWESLAAPDLRYFVRQSEPRPLQVGSLQVVWYRHWLHLSKILPTRKMQLHTLKERILSTAPLKNACGNTYQISAYWEVQRHS